MHSLSYLTVQNFRVCKDVELPLESYTSLVGQNNVGKSTILEAIRWVLKPSTLIAKDFADPAQPVVASACIAGITTALLDRIPDPKHKKAIEPYCANGVLWIRAIAPSPGKKDVKQEVFDHLAYAGQGVPSVWRDYPTGLPQAVLTLLPEPLVVAAMEDIGEDLGKVKAGTTIKDLLDEIMVPVLKAHEELGTALDTIRHILTTDGNNRSGHLKAFDDEATTALGNFFPGLALDLDLQVIDTKDFFKAGDLHVTDKLTGDRRRFDQVGTGAQRAIQMALIRYLAEAKKADVAQLSRRLLLIDEPELYLHPQGVRRVRQALQTLSHSGFQVVLSTHSPLMLNRENAVDTIIVTKDKDKGTITRKPLRQAVRSALKDAESQSRTLFDLGNLAEIYFSERVVLCEGKTDRRLLPIAYERLYGKPPELDQIAFVSLGSCNDIPKALPVLAAMGIKGSAVADLDFAFRGARTGTPELLTRNGQDMTDAMQIMKKLSCAHGFPLDTNGMPMKGNGSQASNAWTLFAQDADGQTTAKVAHDALKSCSVWVWLQGCIEDITEGKDKGEDAIIQQEEKLRFMNCADIEQQMPAFKAYFEWVRGL